MVNWLKYFLLKRNLKSLIEVTFNHFASLQKSDLIVSDSIPILFFGDLKAYNKSPLKIITVSLNPSDKEFSEVRFDTSEEVFKNHNLYLKSLSEYFQLNPYNWFHRYEKLLQNLGASYYSSDKRPSFTCCPNDPIINNYVLHTDIRSPIATSKTWSDLTSYEERKLKLVLEQKGKEIWFDLFNRLKPDLVIMSGAKSLCDYFINDWQEISLAEDFKASHKMRTSDYNNSKVVWLSGYQTPLSFQDVQLKTISDLIGREL